MTSMPKQKTEGDREREGKFNGINVKLKKEEKSSWSDERCEATAEAAKLKFNYCKYSFQILFAQRKYRVCQTRSRSYTICTRLEAVQRVCAIYISLDLTVYCRIDSLCIVHRIDHTENTTFYIWVQCVGMCNASTHIGQEKSASHAKSSALGLAAECGNCSYTQRKEYVILNSRPPLFLSLSLSLLFFSLLFAEGFRVFLISNK